MKKELLTEMLKQHQLWLDSRSREGEQADLSGMSLPGI